MAKRWIVGLLLVCVFGVAAWLAGAAFEDNGYKYRGVESEQIVENI